MSSGEFRGASEKLQKLEQISTDFVLGRLSRRELLRAGMKLGIGTTALAVTVGRMGLLNGAYADEDIAAKLMEELKLPFDSTHDAPDPATREMVPAGKYKKADLPVEERQKAGAKVLSWLMELSDPAKLKAMGGLRLKQIDLFVEDGKIAQRTLEVGEVKLP